jgi:hypothetical protein
MNTIHIYEQVPQLSISSGLSDRIAPHGEKTSNVIMNTSFLPAKPHKTQNTSRRRRAWNQCWATVLMGFLVLVPLVLYSPSIASDSIGSVGQRSVDFCNPSGQSLGTFFEPNMLMGNFTLGQAKAIDIAWNTVVGRGLQFLMAWGSYGIITQGLLRIIEGTPVGYDLFASLTLYPNSLRSMIPLARGLIQLNGWRPKFAMAWLLFSLTLMLSIPSILDASSGYARPTGLILYTGESPNGTYYGPFEQVPVSFYPNEAPKDAVSFKCYPDLSYQWGFASGWIFVTFPLYSVWVFGMYVLWMDAQHNSVLTRSGRRLGECGAAYDLSNAIAQELGPHFRDYSDSEIGKILKSRQGLTYDAQQDESGMEQIRLVSQSSSTSKPA